MVGKIIRAGGSFIEFISILKQTAVRTVRVVLTDIDESIEDSRPVTADGL
jgi:hypothetical protein